MFNAFRKDRRPTWYPDARVTRDRWGTPLNASMGAREFRPVDETPDSVAKHMRWSLGLI